MNKFIAMISLTATLLAEPYVGVGGSISQWTQQDDGIVDCRIGANIIGGVEFENVSIETRYTYGMSNDFSEAGVYLKPHYNNLYALVGYGKTFYDNAKDESGVRYGLGAQHKHVFADVIRKENEDDYIVTVGFLYKF